MIGDLVWSNADLRSFWSSGGTSNFSNPEAAAANVPYVEDQGEEADVRTGCGCNGRGDGK